MSELIELSAQDCVATFNPADSGRLTSFKIAGREILVTQGADKFHSGSFVLAPWVGRLRDAKLNFGGETYQFEPFGGPHAVHGLATGVPWQVTGDGEMSIEIGDEIGSSWPWPCKVVQKTELSEGRARFTIEVHASAPMPGAVGWHPWFARRLAGAPDSAELQLEANPGKMWAHDEAGVPTGELVTPVPRPWDYCFRDLAADPVLRWPGELELTVSSPCQDWVIYDEEEAGICVEPWTAQPNSINMPNPQIITPDAPLVATMEWRWA